MSVHQLDYLDQLESEAIHIMRDVAGQLALGKFAFVDVELDRRS